MPNIEQGLLDFLKTLFESLNTPILIFAIGVIVVVAILGPSVPPTFGNLVYAVAIGAMVGHLLTIVIPLLKSEKVTPQEPQKSTAEELKSGAILYVNVHDFCNLSYSQQEMAIQTLQNELRRFFDFENQDISKGSGYWADFLGGDLVFFSAAESRLLQPQYKPLAQCLVFGMHLQLHTKDMPFELSMTLHWGDDLRIIDIGGNPNLCGSALHKVRHMISFTEKSHFFISIEAFYKLEHNLFRDGMVGSCLNLMKLAMQSMGTTEGAKLLDHIDHVEQNDKYHLEMITLYDHQNQEQRLVNFLVADARGGLRVGNQLLPPSRVKMEFHESEQSIGGVNARLLEGLMQAEEVTLIDVTHYRLVETLAAALEARKNFWKKMEIVIPNESNVRRMIEENRTSSERLAQWESAKKDIQVFFVSKGPEYVGQWKYLECGQDVTLIGSRFVSENKASIHAANVLAGNDLLKVPYIEVVRGSSAFDQFSRTFDIIAASSTSISEWDLFGQLGYDNTFQYNGIVNRAKISLEQRSYCFPVVLIMLYVDTLEGSKSVLQERTVYNATGDIGTYSNISGRLSTKDVISSVQSSRFGINFDTPTYIATRAFNRISGWSTGHPLPEDVWKQAAIREIKEEIGLDITPDRLVERATHYLARDDTNLYFNIFSLCLRQDIDINEMVLIQQRRPHANLQAYTLSELEVLHDQNKLNRLLQRKFKELFVPIFKDLGIVYH